MKLIKNKTFQGNKSYHLIHQFLFPSYLGSYFSSLLQSTLCSTEVNLPSQQHQILHTVIFNRVYCTAYKMFYRVYHSDGGDCFHAQNYRTNTNLGYCDDGNVQVLSYKLKKVCTISKKNGQALLLNLLLFMYIKRTALKVVSALTGA